MPYNTNTSHPVTGVARVAQVATLFHFMPDRVAVYIDGFNLYRAVAKPLDCKWVNLAAMFEAVLRAQRKDETLEFVHFFSAEISGLRVENQRKLLAAYRATDKVRVTLGTFAVRESECEVAACDAKCERFFIANVEKKTDVAIGITMVRDAMNDSFDQAWLVSGDSDFVPAAEMVQDIGKKVRILIPTLGLKGEDHKIRNKADHFRKIVGNDLVNPLPLRQFLHSQMPSPFVGEDGIQYPKPDAWRIAPTTALEDLKASFSAKR